MPWTANYDDEVLLLHITAAEKYAEMFVLFRKLLVWETIMCCKLVQVIKLN